MHVSNPRRAQRSRVLLASALAAALAVLVTPNVPTASANLPVDRAQHRTKVYKVKFDPRLFGVHDYYLNSLQRAGTGSIRLWDAGVQWGDIFPTADSPNWDRLDSLVAEAHANGTEVTLVLGLTPQYAAANPSDPSYPTSMPDLDAWKAYVQAVMSRYSPANWGYRGIAAYQVWNESNISTFWTGTFDQLAQLVKAVHDVRDATDPGAKIVAPAMVTRLGYQQTGLRHFYQTRVGGRPIWKFIDVISLNLYPLDVYPQSRGTRRGTPEDSMAILKAVRTILTNQKVPSSLPIWNTEVNYGLRFGSNGGKPAAPIPNALQVAYVIRTYLLNAAQGIKRVDWYAYDMSDRGGLGPIGNTLLTDPDDRAAGILLPAGRAFTRVESWMRGGTLVGTTSQRPCAKDKHGTYTCKITYARGGVGRVYWNPYKGAKVTLPSGSTRKVDEYGTSSRAKGGTTLKVNFRPVLVRSKR